MRVTGVHKTLSDSVRELIRDVPDFPHAGIVFKDITPLLASASVMREVIDAMTSPFRGDDITHVVAVESRGFMFGMPIALSLDSAFVPARKPGKLPWETVREEFVLEYRRDVLEMHVDALGNSVQDAVSHHDRAQRASESRVLVVDDVLATGGTAAAVCRLVERLGGEVVGVSVLSELLFLNGRAALGDRRLHSVVQY